MPRSSGQLNHPVRHGGRRTDDPGGLLAATGTLHRHRHGEREVDVVLGDGLDALYHEAVDRRDLGAQGGEDQPRSSRGAPGAHRHRGSDRGRRSGQGDAEAAEHEPAGDDPVAAHHVLHDPMKHFGGSASRTSRRRAAAKSRLKARLARPINGQEEPCLRSRKGPRTNARAFRVQEGRSCCLSKLAPSEQPAGTAGYSASPCGCGCTSPSWSLSGIVVVFGPLRHSAPLVPARVVAIPWWAIFLLATAAELASVELPIRKTNLILTLNDAVIVARHLGSRARS